MGPGTVVITGAAGGIGAACARALGRSGRLLLLVDLDASRLGALASALGAEGIAAAPLAVDLCDDGAPAAIAEEAARAGGLAGLAHTAALSGTMADAKRILALNLVATARLLDALLPHAAAGTAAVCIASQAGHLVGSGLGVEVAELLDAPLAPDLIPRLEAAAPPVATAPAGAYGLSKWGVQRLVVARAGAWGARGARLVSLSPGIVDTPMGRDEHDAHRDAMDQILARTPAGARMGRPEEIAAVVRFLCSDEASFVTGVDWLVDGGSTHQMMGAR